MDTKPERQSQSGAILIKRHSAVVRATHWLTAICLFFLLTSGLQIFNAHPSLYWGKYGADADKPFLAIASVEDGDTLRGETRIGGLVLPTTGVLGASTLNGEVADRAFPSWLTLPSGRDLATGRRWHFFFAWAFVATGLVYLIWGFATGHFRRDLAPDPDQLTRHHLAREVVDHARLRFPKGDEARRYGSLQKITYLIVIFALLPLMVLTGLTMSPGFNAAAPWMLDLFGGRQSARSIHFICASLLVAFVAIHLFEVVVSGLYNNIRSMVTGRYAIDRDGARHD